MTNVKDSQLAVEVLFRGPETGVSTMESSLDVFKMNSQNNYLATLIENYKTFSKQSSENVLGLAETVRQASEDLSETLKQIFFTQVGLDPDGSTARKLRRIAEAGERFLPHVERLPNTWTTLYSLAKMSDDDFEALLAGGVLHPLVTMNEISQALKGNKPQRKLDKREVLRLSIPIWRLTNKSEREEIKLEINQLLKKHKLTQEELKALAEQNKISKIVSETSKSQSIDTR